MQQAASVRSSTLCRSVQAGLSAVASSRGAEGQLLSHLRGARDQQSKIECLWSLLDQLCSSVQGTGKVSAENENEGESLDALSAAMICRRD